MKINKKILIKLLEAPGVSGREEVISKILKKQMEKNGLEINYDNLGSIWGIKKSSNSEAKTLMIDSHMDEVGFMITNISDEGFISFEAMGGIWNKTLNSQRLRVWDSEYDKSYAGVVLWPGINSHQGSGKTPKIEDMLLDIGVSNKKELISKGINKGCVVTFDTRTEISSNRIISKAVDNRVGVAMVAQLMEFIKDKEFDYNIVLGASVQEETGLTGARVSTYKIKPDIALVIDVSPALDFPSGTEPTGILGKGTMLRHKDARTIYPKIIVEYLRNLMKMNDIKYQDYFSKGGTNSGNIHLSREGVRTIPLGIVARNLHTGSSVFDINDYNETLKLFELILLDLNSDKIVTFK